MGSMVARNVLVVRMHRRTSKVSGSLDGCGGYSYHRNNASFTRAASTSTSSGPIPKSKLSRESHGSSSSSGATTLAPVKSTTNKRKGKEVVRESAEVGPEGKSSSDASTSYTTRAGDELRFTTSTLLSGTSASTTPLATSLDSVLNESPIPPLAGSTSEESKLLTNLSAPSAFPSNRDSLPSSKALVNYISKSDSQDRTQGTENSHHERRRKTYLPPPSHQNFPLPRVPFSTHRFIRSLEQAEIKRPLATVLMKATRALLLRHEEKARDALLSRQDLENEAYLFSAAMSELKTGAQLKTRNDVVTLKSLTASLQRETDSVSQRLKEDMQRLQSDIQLDMNSRKEETSQQLTALDMKVMSLNSKYTIVLGDVRTEIEATRWVVVRRVMGVVVFIAIIGSTSLSAFGPSKKAREAKPPPSIEELGVSSGTSEEAEVTPAGWFGWTTSTAKEASPAAAKIPSLRMGESSEDET